MKHRRKGQKKRIKWIVLGLLCVFLYVGCGVGENHTDSLINVEIQQDVENNETVYQGEGIENVEQGNVVESDAYGEAVKKAMKMNPTIHADDPTNKNMAGMLQDAAKGVIVQIHMNQVGGSGVIWQVEEEQLVIVTAAHVLAENSGQVQITFADGYEVESSEYIIEASADIAFVYVPVGNIPLEHLSEYYLANVDKNKYDEIASGDIVIACGSVSEPGGEAYEGTLIENWIWVEDFNQYMMLAKLVADAGMSGGGVFDEEGYFLGIICGINEEGEAAILPLAIIESTYQGLNN